MSKVENFTNKPLGFKYGIGDWEYKSDEDGILYLKIGLPIVQEVTKGNPLQMEGYLGQRDRTWAQDISDYLSNIARIVVRRKFDRWAELENIKGLEKKCEVVLMTRGFYTPESGLRRHNFTASDVRETIKKQGKEKGINWMIRIVKRDLDLI